MQRSWIALFKFANILFRQMEESLHGKSHHLAEGMIMSGNYHPHRLLGTRCSQVIYLVSCQYSFDCNTVCLLLLAIPRVFSPTPEYNPIILFKFSESILNLNWMLHQVLCNMTWLLLSEDQSIRLAIQGSKSCLDVGIKPRIQNKQVKCCTTSPLAHTHSPSTEMNYVFACGFMYYM